MTRLLARTFVLCLQPTQYYTKPGGVPRGMFHRQVMDGISAPRMIQLMRLQYTTSNFEPWIIMTIAQHARPGKVVCLHGRITISFDSLG
jgi:hypothetical protein